MRRSCKGCVHYDVCTENKVCDDYFPINAHGESIYVEQLIESGRENFHSDWHEYITKFYD